MCASARTGHRQRAVRGCPVEDVFGAQLTTDRRRRHDASMIRTLIQLPDSVFERARRVAKAKEISLAELARRGLETILDQYPSPELIGQAWTAPRVRSGGVKACLARLKEFGEAEAAPSAAARRRAGA